MNENPINTSNKRLAYFGAIIAITTVFFYSLIVLIYIIIRSSLTIYEIMLSEVKLAILLENAISMGYSIAVFSIIMAIISSLVGIVTAIILKKSLSYFNPKCLNRKAKIISGITAILIACLIYLLLRFTLKDWMTFNYIEPFLFWFLIPAILFLIFSIVGGSQLNGLLKLQNKH
jgi:hypothetical protein